MPRASTKKKSTKLTFGKFKGRTVSQLPQSYLAWMVGYTRIGKPGIVLPREQLVNTGESFRHKRPEIYFAAMQELISRAKCLVCDGRLIPFKATRDWKSRLLHKKCYYKHVDEIIDTVGFH